MTPSPIDGKKILYIWDNLQHDYLVKISGTGFAPLAARLLEQYGPYTRFAVSNSNSALSQYRFSAAGD